MKTTYLVARKLKLEAINAKIQEEIIPKFATSGDSFLNKKTYSQPTKKSSTFTMFILCIVFLCSCTDFVVHSRICC